MPGGRGGRGGPRAGTPGQSYTNRTDLNVTRTLPVAAPTGLEYGQRKALVDSQRAAPIVVPDAVATPPPSAPAGPPPVLPGSLPPLDRASERPGEPVTHGAPLGAGAGPEVLGVGSPTTLADAIAVAATASGSSDLAFLADQARRMRQ